MAAETRGVLPDFVLELADIDVQKVSLEDAWKALAHLVGVAREIARDQYLEQIEPWEEGHEPADVRLCAACLMAPAEDGDRYCASCATAPDRSSWTGAHLHEPPADSEGGTRD